MIEVKFLLNTNKKLEVAFPEFITENCYCKTALQSTDHGQNDVGQAVHHTQGSADPSEYISVDEQPEECI